MLLPAAPQLLSHPPAKSFQEPGRHQGDAKGGGCGCRGALGVWRWVRPPQDWLSGDGGSKEAPGWAWGSRSTVPSPRTSRPAGASAYQHGPEGQAWAPAVSQQAQCDVLAITVLHPSKPSTLSQQAQYGAPAIPEPCPNKTSVVSHQAQYRVPSSPIPCPSKPRAISQQAQCRVLTSPAPHPSNPSTASQQAQYGGCPRKPSIMSQQTQCYVPAIPVPCPNKSKGRGPQLPSVLGGGEWGVSSSGPCGTGGDLPAGGWEPRCPTPASPRCWPLPAPLPPRRGG